jgi:hypothetical protein
MKLWKQWSRKLDGWVERRRRFQKTATETVRDLAGQRVPAVAVARAPVNVPDPDKTR